MITLHANHLDILDEGSTHLETTSISSLIQDAALSSGLGLYIVSLACEALGWKLSTLPQERGSLIQLTF